MPHKGLIKKIKKVAKRATAPHRRVLKRALRAVKKRTAPARRVLKKAKKKSFLRPNARLLGLKIKKPLKKKPVASSKVRRPRKRPGLQ